jgi:hypothetical protein
MNAADLPYQLRPNKFIDRELFVDLLSLIVPYTGADKYLYISMGGQHLVDHSAVYRKIGIPNLYAFDSDENTVKRQLFNRPIDMAKCDALHSGSLAGALDGVAAQFPVAKNVIVWLDYTNPHERLTQIQELVEVAKRLQPGDILRVTMNANLGTLDEWPLKWKEESFPSPKEYRLARLKTQLGSYVPTDLDGIGENDFAAVLCRCIELAIAKVEGERPKITLRPVLLTSYRDGQRMVTATCLAELREGQGMPDGLRRWRFLPSSWTDLTMIEAPNLSIREKMRIDESLSEEAAEIAKKLGFSLAETKEKGVAAIHSYQVLHRYYPEFHNVDV